MEKKSPDIKKAAGSKTAETVSKTPKASKAPKAPKTPKAPKAPKAPKTPKAPKAVSAEKQKQGAGKSFLKFLPWLIGGCVCFVLVFILISFITSRRYASYRVVKLEDYEGDVDIERNNFSVNLFEGLQLIAGDLVSTGEDSWLALLIDSDKHIGADANTVFFVQADGDETKGAVTIELESGSALFTIDQKLNEDSTFEVTTPNATLSVRGTTFSVSYNPSTATTSTTVTEGVVEASYGDGESVELHAGEGGFIRDDVFTEQDKPYLIVTRTYPVSGNAPDTLRFAYTLRGNENKSVWSLAGNQVSDGNEMLAKTAFDLNSAYIEPHNDEINSYMESYRESRLNQPAPDLPQGSEDVSGWYLDTFTFGNEDAREVTEWFPETIDLELENGTEHFRIRKAVMWPQVFDEYLSDGIIEDAYVKELGFGLYGSPE